MLVEPGIRLNEFAFVSWRRIVELGSGEMSSGDQYRNVRLEFKDGQARWVPAPTSRPFRP